MGAWLSPKEIPRPSLVEGLPGRGKVVYERKSVHTSQTGPYGIKITCPSATITGIACCPGEDDKIQSPVAVVFVLQAEACNTSTTQTQPHQISNTQRTENKTTDVVIQQHSHKLLMMDILMSDTC